MDCLYENRSGLDAQLHFEYKLTTFGFVGFVGFHSGGAGSLDPIMINQGFAMGMLSPKQVVAYLSLHGIFVIDDTVRAWTCRGVADRTKKGRVKRKILAANRVGGRIQISEKALISFIPHLKHVQE